MSESTCSSTHRLLGVLSSGFTQTDIPAQEQMVEREQWCPPHDFQAAWAIPASGADETGPALYCAMCGDIRLFRIPATHPDDADPDDEC